ncbi:MAG TPA: TIGR02391 family protein [Pseudonocardiaceae bacterium]|nr:TIGR02391 family protein [Pseudonocardiaceae bacterium]
MSAALALVDAGRISEAVFEALRLVEERVRSQTASNDSEHALMESVYGTRPTQLDITTTTGQRPRTSVRVSDSCSSIPYSGCETRTVPVELFLPQWTRY